MGKFFRFAKISQCMLVLVVFGLGTFAIAQEPKNQNTRDEQSNRPTDYNTRSSLNKEFSALEKENLSRVAASAAQLREVLVKDPGLMVELKRWTAKEATDNGQIVSDENLTDDAIYDRLTNDVPFRSVATRLVQRYGYLMPGFNPESDKGKEQDLLIKERVRRLAQIEEDADSLKSKNSETNGTSSVPCESYDDRECVQGASGRSSQSITNPGQNVPQRNITPDQTYPGYPNYQNYPNYPSYQNQEPQAQTPQIMQTDTGSDYYRAQYGGSADESALLESISDPLGQLGGSSNLGTMGLATGMGMGLGTGMGMGMGMGMGSNLPGSVSPDRLQAGVAQALGNRYQEGSTLPEAKSDMRTDMGYLYRRAPRLTTERESLSNEMVHRPSPYADIPSLYDLYEQAPSRDRPPRRFGSEVFRDGLRDPRSVPMDLPVGPDYVVGPGDSLSIDLWGGVSTKIVRVVDREGRVTLPEAGPLLVSGKSLGEVQLAVQKAIGTEFRDTQADVSVSRLRTIRVYVVGEVEEPGAYDISSLSTALNALVAAGGATARGSLRNLKHVRGREAIERIDAYDLLLRGVTPDAKIFENGDTLMVPLLGPQVTVTGMVRRPAIYELDGEKSVEDVLELAGGILPAAALRHVEVQRLEAHEKRTMLTLDLSPDNLTHPQLSSFKVQDGDEIHIFPIAPYNQDEIYLQGHVLRPGRYSYRTGMKLTDLVTSYKDILPEPAAHYGEIIRLDPPDFHPTVVSFDLAAALKDPATAPALEPLDTVRIFSRFDFEPAPTVSVVGEVRSPGTYRTSGQASLRDAVYLAGGLTPDAALDTSQLFRINPDGTSKIFSVDLREALAGNAADNILLQPRDRLLIHRNTAQVDPSTIEITGAVAKPGLYPYTQNMHVEDLIRAAGGLKRSADTNTADLTRYAASGGVSEQLQISLASLNNGNATEDIPLRSGDVLAIRQVPSWTDIGASVKVSGEVKHPSTYGIQPGERLSAVLERAGGYTGQAYPYGAVLMRREVRELEARNQMELVTRLKVERLQLRDLPETTEDQKNTKLNALAQTDATLGQLSTNPPVGRVVIHISSNIKQWKDTPADIVLRDGDVLMIPKKANVVMVTGQVFNPTAITTQSSKSARWYLGQAGGLTPIADKKGVFVIRADGSVLAAKNTGAVWFLGDPLNGSLRAGDTVVVPEKTPKVGGANWATLMQTAQVASSVALAVAYIHP
ncbi:MAG: SLBB domain-containing protein [Candidatus Acidiferrum sp.]